MRRELTDYYWYQVDNDSEKMRVQCETILNNLFVENESATKLKAKQYEVITHNFQPKIFKTVPFYYEMGTMSAQCDGAGEFRGHLHTGGWVYRQNRHLFRDQNPQAYDKMIRQEEEALYIVCGDFSDTRQHFHFNYRAIFEKGIKGLYEDAQAQLNYAQTEEEKEFLETVCVGLLCLKKIAEKFSVEAEKQLETATTEEEKCNLTRIMQRAKIVPWEKPETFYDALNTYALLRKAVGALEGVGLNTFLRLDVDLYPFYERDIKEGRLTKEEAYDLIARFLVVWDSHYNQDSTMIGYSDHELENTYTIGGCDKNGDPVYNEITEMLLRATREEKVIFPKVICRFSSQSPKAYLDEINKDVIKGRSVVLFQNDEATIPALLKSGKTLEEARDYIVTGCWGLGVPSVENPDFGQYLNLLKAFEFSLHNRVDKMERTQLSFELLDEARDFEEFYQITLRNIKKLFFERANLTSVGGRIWNKVDCLALISASMEGCIEKRKDYTSGGAKYNNRGYTCVGFPNIVDSFLAVKKLCFEEKVYSLKEYLFAVRQNWVGFEQMRRRAMQCPCWGDESEESCALAKRFQSDLCAILPELPNRWEGRALLGHLTYTEIKWWGEKTLATPDGRKNGDYISQGVTPSRLHYIESATMALNSIKQLDLTDCADNTVINIVLPSTHLSLDNAEDFLRATAKSGAQALQLNCVTKEALLDAQTNPEEHKDIVVRVCGFSARFTSLSKGWQDEFISRNFYR